MFKKITLLAVLFYSSVGIAGDGGFLLKTCISESGRTNLTIFQDNYSGATIPEKVMFAIDGQFISYAPEVGKCMGPDGSIVEDDCLNIQVGSQSVWVNQGDVLLMKINFGENLSASIDSGFYDPRPEYENTPIGSINLSCKEYYLAP